MERNVMGLLDKDFDTIWDDIGGIVDRAVSSQDYQKLNQNVRHSVNRAVDLGTDAVRRAKRQPAQSIPTNSGVAYGDRMQSWGLKDRDKELYGNTGGKQAVGILKIIGGGLVMGFTGISLLVSAAVSLIAGAALPVSSALIALVGAGSGAALLGSGIVDTNRISRFKRYRKALGTKTHCTLKQLAQAVGKNEKFVRKDLLRMIRQGLFRQGCFDKEQTCLLTSQETYRYFEQSRLQLEARKQQEEQQKQQLWSDTPQVREVLERGHAFIAQIRKCNDDIPGEEISRKIDHMEELVRRIFARAKAAPEVIPDLKKLMDHYLPMTVKLLNAYADMDAQPVQGETIQASKREIEQTLDTLNLAYEKLLDDLFADTALDVSSDITVLNTLLAQEGLAQDELTKLKNKQNL